MDISVDTILQVLGMIGVIGVQTWALVRYLIDRTDRLIATENKEKLEMIAKLHERVNTLSAETVKREEFNIHVTSMREDSKNLLQMMNNLGQAINTRLDGVLLMLAKGKDNNGSQG